MQPILGTTLLSLLCFTVVIGVELTFELPDNAKQCFHEDIQQGVKSTVEFQVSRGHEIEKDNKSYKNISNSYFCTEFF